MMSKIYASRYGWKIRIWVPPWWEFKDWGYIKMIYHPGHYHIVAEGLQSYRELGLTTA
jgi:hypothetical protein